MVEQMHFKMRICSRVPGGDQIPSIKQVSNRTTVRRFDKLLKDSVVLAEIPKT